MKEQEKAKQNVSALGQAIGLSRWHEFGRMERGALQKRTGPDGPECLLVENVTGSSGWESEGLPIEGAGPHLLSWSVKCVGKGDFAAPEPQNDTERKYFSFWTAKDWPFHWFTVCDFIGIELTFLDAQGAEIETRSSPMAVETYTGVFSRDFLADYVEGRGDFTRFWTPVWFEFSPPSHAAAIRVRFLVTCRGRIDAGLAIADVRLAPATPADKPRKGFSRYIIRTFESATGKPVGARISIRNEQGAPFVPPCAISGDFPQNYFYSLSGESSVDLPAGRYHFEAVKGFEYETARAHAFYVMEGETEIVELEMVRALDMASNRWFAGDHHLHISGHATKDYPMLDVATGLKMAACDGISYVPFQADYFSYQRRGHETLRCDETVIGQFASELCSQIWGHYCTLGAKTPYPGMVDGHVLYPTMYDVVKTINANGGACFAAHPTQMIRNPQNTVHWKADMAEAVSDPRRWNTAKELPLILLLGEHCGFDLMIADGWQGQPMATREYYRLLDFGFRAAAGGSTDTGVNSRHSYFPGPRTYVHAGELSWAALAEGVRGCHTFATNGPSVLMESRGKIPGDNLLAQRGEQIVVNVETFSPWGLAFVELIYNGRPVARAELSGHDHAKAAFSVTLTEAGWLCAVVRGPGSPWLNSSMMVKREQAAFGQMAHTSPVFIRFKDQPLRPSSETAGYYARWISNLRKIADAHRHLLDRNAHEAGVSAAEAWDTIMGRIDKALETIESIRKNGWPQ